MAAQSLRLRPCRRILGLEHMASRLLVTDHFLQSEFAPAICVFSGRPTGGFRQALKLAQAPVDLSEKSGFTTFAKGWRPERTGKVAVPQVPGQYLHQRLRRLYWIVPMLGLPLAGVLTGLRWIDTPQDGNLPGYLGLVGAVLGIAIALAIKFWVMSHNTELRLMGEKGVVEIRFPTHLRAVFDQYKAAWKNYEAAMSKTNGQ